jgi:GT2 family glycosyltransferase
MRDRTWAVVVHYGDPAFTRRCVGALRGSSDLPAEHILVVEEGSPSGVPPDSGRTLSHGGNKGFAAGVNVGTHTAFTAGADYALVLNNDVVIPQGALEALLRNADTAQPRIGCVGAVLDEGDARPVYGGGGVSWVRGRAHLAHDPTAAAVLHYISGACFLLTRSCIEDVGGFPEKYFLYWEDVAFGFAARKRGWQLSWARTPLVSHPRSQGTDPAEKTYYLVRNGALFAHEYAPRAARSWLRTLEPLRERWAVRHGAWAVVHGLRDARAGVTGPRPPGRNLLQPP